MRHLSGGVAHVASVIEADLFDRDTNLYKPHIIGLSDLAASVLACRSVNTSDLAAILPRVVKSDEERYRYINRLLSNPKIIPNDVMSAYICDVLQEAGSDGRTAILMIDQSKISDGFECLMISLRLANRAIPVAWKVIETKGAIGFDIQKRLLDEVAEMIPDGIKIMLAGDRFYGTSSLVYWCQKHGWQYRIRLKGNLVFEHNDSEITCLDAVKIKLKSLESVKFNRTDIETNVGILHEKGHKEPWFIAMDCKPNKYKILDYGMRWGIECMFSDFKSRGFGITNTLLKHADRIERLILVLAIALYWAVSTGMSPKPKPPPRSKKKNTDP